MKYVKVALLASSSVTPHLRPRPDTMRYFLLLLIVLPLSLFAQVNADTFEEPAENGVDLYVRNDEYSPVTFRFKLNLKNMTAEPENTFSLVVPARTDRFLAYQLRLAPEAREYGYGYEYEVNTGNHLETGYDEDHVYELPIAPGREVLISQGYNGIFSHKDMLALDFNLPQGVPIHAARGGIVVDVVDHNTRGCPSPNCEQFENRVVVLHTDGTFAGYAHLQHKSAQVAVGDTVQTGHFIGRVGATGYANGPHLHFSVYRQLMAGRSYVPTVFRLLEKGARTQVQRKLEEKVWYKRPE